MFTVADPQKGLWDLSPPPFLFFDPAEGPTEGQKKMIFFRPPPILSQGLDDWVPPYLKVWMRHWFITFIHDDDMHV